MKTAEASPIQPESPWAFTMADRLAKALDVAGITGTHMAEYLGISLNTVSNYTNGRTSPKKQTLRLWALKTGAPLEWIETGIDPTEGNPHQSPDGGNVGPAGIEPTTSTVKTGMKMGEVIPLFPKAA